MSKPNSSESPSHVSVVLDTETLNLSPDSVITEFGAIAFNRETFEVIEEIEIQPCVFRQLAAGRSYSRETIEFHIKENSLPLPALAENPMEACISIANFFARNSPVRVWIQGTDFDRPLLENFFQQNRRPLPWKFSISADARTIWKTAFPGTPHEPRPHHALADCHATLADLHKALRALNATHAA